MDSSSTTTSPPLGNDKTDSVSDTTMVATGSKDISHDDPSHQTNNVMDTATTSTVTSCKMEVNKVSTVFSAASSVGKKRPLETITTGSTAKIAGEELDSPSMKRERTDASIMGEETILFAKSSTTSSTATATPSQKKAKKSKKKKTYYSIVSSMMAGSPAKKTLEEQRNDLMENLGGGSFAKVAKI